MLLLTTSTETSHQHRCKSNTLTYSECSFVWDFLASQIGHWLYNPIIHQLLCLPEQKLEKIIFAWLDFYVCSWFYSKIFFKALFGTSGLNHCEGCQVTTWIVLKLNLEERPRVFGLVLTILFWWRHSVSSRL